MRLEERDTQPARLIFRASGYPLDPSHERQPKVPCEGLGIRQN